MTAFSLAIPTIMYGGDKLAGGSASTLFMVGWGLWCAVIVGADLLGSKYGGAAKGAHNGVKKNLDSVAVAPGRSDDESDADAKKSKGTRQLGDATSGKPVEEGGMPRMILAVGLFVSGAIMIAGVVSHE